MVLTEQEEFVGKRFCVVGFGLSGVAAARYLIKQGAYVSVLDSRPEQELSDSLSACEGLKLDLRLGLGPRFEGIDFLTFDKIILSPGITPSLKPLQEARNHGLAFSSEVELAAKHLQFVPVIAVTGTNGKTTTTHLITAFLQAAGKRVFLGGNVGNPLLNYFLNHESADFVVAELSSFQLEQLQSLCPKISILLNVDEDHLDRYVDFETYFEAKKRLMLLGNKDTDRVLNFNQELLRPLKNLGQGRTHWISKNEPAFGSGFSGTYFNSTQKKMVSRLANEEFILDISGFKLFGEHNRENLAAAVTAVRLLGIAQADIQAEIPNLRGVAHRLEFIRKKDGVFFFNDSKATNVASVMKSLESFSANPIILIAGGKDKGIDFSPLAQMVQKRCKILILLGEAKEKINRALGDYAETFLVGTFEEAVLLSYQKSRSGDIVLLSPACSSYDMFKDFEERGNYFKKLVSQL